jgi:hypothetical protein
MKLVTMRARSWEAVVSQELVLYTLTSGMGRFIEGFQRTYKFGAILGGSEEIMADLGVRQAMRNFPNARL